MHQQDCQLVLSESPMAELYQQYSEEIFRYIRRHVISREDAEDVLLEVFIAALESETLMNLKDKEQFAWLRRVARNKFVDHHRQRARRPTVSLDEAENLYDDETLAPDQVAVRHEEYRHLYEQVAMLPEQQQMVLQLRFAAGLRSNEIARRLNKRDGTVRMLLSRSLNFLRSIYEQQDEKR